MLKCVSSESVANLRGVEQRNALADQFAVEARRHSYMASQHTASWSKAYRTQTVPRSTRQAGKGGDEAQCGQRRATRKDRLFNTRDASRPFRCFISLPEPFALASQYHNDCLVRPAAPSSCTEKEGEEEESPHLS